MKQKIFILSLILFISLTITIFAEEKTTEITIPNPLGETSDIYTLIEKITNFLIGIAIVVTPIIIVYAGFIYITAGGNEEKVKTAQKVLIWALIGFALVLIARGVPALIKQFLGISEKTCDPPCEAFFKCVDGECVDNCYGIDCGYQVCQPTETGHECVTGSAPTP